MESHVCKCRYLSKVASGGVRNNEIKLRGHRGYSVGRCDVTVRNLGILASWHLDQPEPAERASHSYMYTCTVHTYMYYNTDNTTLYNPG
jgi:hypothetical protein